MPQIVPSQTRMQATSSTTMLFVGSHRSRADSFLLLRGRYTEAPNVPHGAGPEEPVLLHAEVTAEEDEDPSQAQNGEEVLEVGSDQETGGAFAEDSSEDEDDMAMVADTIGEAPKDPPPGLIYAPVAPPLATDDDLKALVGQHILHAWDSAGCAGWYVGRISARGCSARDLRATPSANFVVTYDKRITKNKNLHGRVASALTMQKYGPKEWWILLQPIM